ncbi:protein AATF [Zootermopsis nevadensis]|uniref:Protein AATF n=1 Tax=Zootermopsis nevadensis TaxID=136037 RepID=A0A067QXR2_ZOONE|nr:protein AATF [Zootermopsis nevadensis]KDR15251.1 Protein AATF [Zootermopsis nevadensis]
MGTKRKSLSECFVDLINPAPASFDPEDDIYPDTVAKVVENEDGFSDEEKSLNELRKRNIDLIEEGDERYNGAKISRKALEMQGGDTDDELESSKEGSSQADDSYISGGEEDENQEDSPDEINRNKVLQPENDEDTNSFQHISCRSMETETEKGIAVRNQLNVWDCLLECRIMLQKTLTAANKLPQHNIFEQFTAQGGPEFKAEIQQTIHTVTTLLESLIAFRTIKFKSYPETETLYKKAKYEGLSKKVDKICSDTDEDNGDSSNDKNEVLHQQKKHTTKHRTLEHYSELISDHHKMYLEYRNANIQKWNDKTRVLAGKLSSRNFSTFEQSTLKQIEQILNNRQRLIQRSQLKRSSYGILGQELIPQQQQENSEEPIVSTTADNLKTERDQSKEYSTEIYDDTDFYHQLLRELIERKSSDVTDPVQLGRQWLELQKLRSKMKRKIDTRATKGRKIRYAVHSKLINFMAPVSQNLYSEEAKTELYNSLFGNGRRY